MALKYKGSTRSTQWPQGTRTLKQLVPANQHASTMFARAGTAYGRVVRSHGPRGRGPEFKTQLYFYKQKSVRESFNHTMPVFLSAKSIFTLIPLSCSFCGLIYISGLVSLFLNDLGQI